MIVKHLGVLTLLILSVVLTGCGGGSELPEGATGTVKGRLTIEGEPAEEGTVILGGVERSIDGAKANLIIEANILKRKDQSPADATVIIRGDANVAAGDVQKLVQICQEAEFETFALRAEEKYD